MTRPRLRLIGGVCAGFATHTGLPVAVVRTATLVLALCGGAGALLYAWLWATTPTATASTAAPLRSVLVRPAGEDDAAAARTDAHDDATPAWRTAPITEVLLGIALIGAGIALVASRLGAEIPLEFVVPAVVVLAGAGLAWRQFDDLRSGSRPRSSATVVRVLGALVLVALGILLFFVTGSEPNIWTVVAAAVAVLVGVAVVVAPWVVRMTRDLADERAARTREVERAEIAAHLHDSVLQTLALIQQKAGPHSEASRLARAQERELREWLFEAPAAANTDLTAQLREIAATIERDYAARVDVVTVGAPPDTVPEPFVAAAREAMLNAARHAGGSVSVYLEASVRGIELSVIDRGPGFSIDDIPADRMGVRESIIGRMQRIGGRAAIRPGPGGTGTEVRLTLFAAGQAETAGRPANGREQGREHRSEAAAETTPHQTTNTRNEQ